MNRTSLRAHFYAAGQQSARADFSRDPSAPLHPSDGAWHAGHGGIADVIVSAHRVSRVVRFAERTFIAGYAEEARAINTAPAFAVTLSDGSCAIYCRDCLQIAATHGTDGGLGVGSALALTLGASKCEGCDQ